MPNVLHIIIFKDFLGCDLELRSKQISRPQGINGDRVKNKKTLIEVRQQNHHSITDFQYLMFWPHFYRIYK